MPEELFIKTDIGTRKGEKIGGIHKSQDQIAGRYTFQDGSPERMQLVKRDEKKPENDIGEFLASQIFQELAPDQGPKVSLYKKDHKTYLVSEYFQDNYQDLSKHKAINEDEKRDSKLEALQASIGLGQVKRKILKLVRSEEFGKGDCGYEPMMSASIAVGDFSTHTDNIGFKDNPITKKKMLVRIDFGAAFRSDPSEFDLFTSRKNRAGFEKNYLLRDHPKKLIYTEKFAQTMKDQSQKDLTRTIDKSWEAITKSFNDDAIKAFGKRIGANVEGQNFKEDIKKHFKNHMAERQKKMSEFVTSPEFEKQQAEFEKPKRKINISQLSLPGNRKYTKKSQIAM